MGNVDPLYYYFTRTPPLTLLHLSASKFSDAPSARGITGFLSSEASSTQFLFSTTQPTTQVSSEGKHDTPSKRLGSIESLFQKAAEKHKHQMSIQAEEDEGSETENTAQTPSSSVSQDIPTESQKSSSSFRVSTSPGAPSISSFFHKQKIERSLQALASNVHKSETVFCLDPVSKATSVALEADFQTNLTNENLSSNSAFHDVHHSELDVDSSSISDDLSKLSGKIDREDLLTCEKCGQEVSVWEMPEHNDYHFAMELQKSLSSSSSSPSTSSSSVPQASHKLVSAVGKTKSRSQTGPQTKRQRSVGGNTGTLDSFFKRS